MPSRCWSRSRSSPASSTRWLVTGDRPARAARRSERQHRRAQWQGRRQHADRPAVQRSEVLLGPAVGDVADALQRRRVERVPTSGRPILRSRTRVKGRIEALRSGRPGQHGAGARRPRHGLGQRPRSAHQSRPPPTTRLRALRRREASTSRGSARSSPSIRTAGSSDSWASPSSTCSTQPGAGLACRLADAHDRQRRASRP